MIRRHLAPGEFELLFQVAAGDALEQDLGPALLGPLIHREGVRIHGQQRALVARRQLQDGDALLRPQHGEVVLLAEVGGLLAPDAGGELAPVGVMGRQEGIDYLLRAARPAKFCHGAFELG